MNDRPSNLETPLSRMFQATGSENRAELAFALGVQPPDLAQAQRTGNIPADWLITLWYSQGINPIWVMTGVGPRHVFPGSDDVPGTSSTDGLTLQNIVRCIPTWYLTRELKIRGEL